MEKLKAANIKVIRIEGIPFITRFKTLNKKKMHLLMYRIEGIPFITRFKTPEDSDRGVIHKASIEGIPFITRFKTSSIRG